MATKGIEPKQGGRQAEIIRKSPASSAELMRERLEHSLSRYIKITKQGVVEVDLEGVLFAGHRVLTIGGIVAGSSKSQDMRDNTTALVAKYREALTPGSLSARSMTADIVQSRCSNIFSRMLDLDEQVLAVAAKQPDDLAVLHYLLARPEVAGLPIERDGLDAARMRGMAQKRELLQAEGGSRTTSEVAELLGVTPQAITKRRKLGRLIAVELGTKGFHYPVWQFDLPGFEAVLEAMRDRDGWEQISFFLNPNEGLGGKRPLDVLRRKQVAVSRVVTAALEFGEAGA